VSQAAFERLSVAVVLSATLHLYLIYGLALQPTHSPADYVSIINARLLPEPAVTKWPAAPAMQRERIVAVQPAAQAPPAGDRSPEPEGSTPSLPDPVHYAARDLDVYPQPLNGIEPVYPQTALAGEIGGWVTLLLLIDESGRVTDASVVDAFPPDVFEESALRALAATVYSPAQKNGRAVRSRILVKLDYDPAATAVDE